MKNFNSNQNQTAKRFSAKKLTVTAMLAALASVLMFIDFPIPFLIPSFVKFDFSELPALIAAFVVSPLAGAAVCLIKNLINLLFTTTAGVGELCNFLIGISMVIPAGLIYKYRHTRGGAAAACITGSVIMALFSIIVNYYISYPFYQTFMPLEAIFDAYDKINPFITSSSLDNNAKLWLLLICFNAPFTLLKGIACSAVTFVVYKPLSNALKFGTPAKSAQTAK